MKFLFIAAFLALVGCVTERPAVEGMKLMPPAEFEKTVDRFTDHQQTYSGLYNTLDVQATLVSTPVMRAQLDNQARLYSWDRAKFSLESNRADENLRNQTEVFMSFFTPEKKNDDLGKTKSQWRIYLESGGHRWEGKVTKVKGLLPELQGLYPYHNRFATPYSVTFPVPTRTVQAMPSKLFVTGPIGHTELEFPAAEE